MAICWVEIILIPWYFSWIEKIKEHFAKIKEFLLKLSAVCLSGVMSTNHSKFCRYDRCWHGTLMVDILCIIRVYDCST